MTTERERVTKSKAEFGKAEKALRAIGVHFSAMMELHRETDAAKFNAAFLARARVMKALGYVEEAHGMGTEDLLRHWPEHGEIVVMGGGGGR